MKKFFATIAMTAIMALSLGMLAGCGGPSDEEVVKEALTAELDACVNLDEATIEELSSGMDLAELESFGIDAVAFMQSYLDGFDYSIDSITVEGERAEAIVTLTCKSFKGFQQAFEADINALMADPASVAGLSEDELNAKLGGILMDAIGNTELAQTAPITIVYTKQNNTWTPDSTAEQNISTAMLTN